MMIEESRLYIKNEMVKNVKGRFAGIEDNYLLLVATRPEIQRQVFSSNISKSIANEAVQEELRKISGASDSETNASASESRTDSPSPKKQKRGSLLELFSDILYADDSSSTNELDCYLREPVYKMGKPFTLWAEHHSRYPAIFSTDS